MSKVLIFEDEFDVRIAMEEVAEKLNFDCRNSSFASSVEALDYLEENKGEQIELALLDIVEDVPGKKVEDAGIQIARKLREYVPSVPIVFYTASSPETFEDIIEEFEGSVTVVAKNVGTSNTDEVIEAIDAQLKNLPIDDRDPHLASFLGFRAGRSRNIIHIEKLAYIKSEALDNQDTLYKVGFMNRQNVLQTITLSNRISASGVGRYIAEDLGRPDLVYAPPRTGILINPYHISKLDTRGIIYFSEKNEDKLEVPVNHISALERRMRMF